MEKIKNNYVECITHYDLLVSEGNDPVYDNDELKEYMNQWDGDLFLRELGLGNNSTALEIGVGTGRLAIKTAPKCKLLVGIDISKKTIEQAKDNLHELKNVELYYGDFLTYNFQYCFDVIYSSQTFMHFKDKLAPIIKIAELLKPEGKVVISIEKNQSKEIDFGNRKVKVYPDQLSVIIMNIEKSNLHVNKVLELEKTYVIVAYKKTR